MLVTRRMPSAVLAQLEVVCDIDLHDHSDALSHDALCARVGGKQGLICMFNDRIEESAIAAGDQLKVVATVAVGFDNIDVAAAASRGVVVPLRALGVGCWGRVGLGAPFAGTPGRRVGCAPPFAGARW
ncbi:MAG: hypothetical protein CL477_13145, partial [Acidobacteria bacterium]|nr:hypothetical protein [Acidobacteriota bacterium]